MADRGGIHIEVDVANQALRVLAGDRLLQRFPVSTSAFGLGEEEGSFRTPRGLFRVAEKIGAGAALGAAFRQRVATEEVWTPDASPTEEDLVLTRILWLEGREPANASTLERHIYIHGTNREDRIGTPASHGCVRMRNADVVLLFDRVTEGDRVRIQ